MEHLTFGMKNTQEAIAIRNHVLLTFEKMIIQKARTDDGNWNIVIVGSGPTGVELAGAFSEMKKEILPRDYPHMNFDDLKIVVISSTSKPLNVMSKEAQEMSEKYLLDLGVHLMSDEFVTDYDGDIVTMKSGKTIASNNVIWAAGVTGNVIDGLNPEIVIRNRYKTDRYNRVQGYENIFAIGDIAYMETPKNLSKNLVKKHGDQWSEYEYNDQGSMATIGKHRAVVDLPNFRFQGFLAWYFWMFLHLMLILSVRNKLAVFFNWMWSYINKDSSLRLIIVKNKNNDTEQ